jgi:LytS/YehU family sensor histidine kinase
LYNLQEKTEQQQKMDEIQVEKLKTEVNYLRAQINPHFLFNTLNNIYALSLEKSDKTPEIIMRLSKMMDYMLYESDELLVPLKNEVENLDNYVTIERLRQGNNGKINYTVKGEITDQRIVPLIFLPLIENGFKHGINQIIRAAFLDINLTISRDHIELSVINNFRPEAVTSRDRNGIGLQNLTKRLELFYPGKYKLELKQEMGIYDVHLNISFK